MSDYKSIKTEELTKIANAIRYKTGNRDKISLEAMAKEIREIEGGVSLPELENEGAAADLLSGKQLIDSDGNIVEGTIVTKTASDLTTSGATVTVPAGYYATQASKSVTTTTRADTTISVSVDDTNDKLTITASNNQSTGYVTGANKTATTTVTLTASGATVTASDGSKSISKSVATATQATPSVSVNSSGLITATATQTAGYVSAGSKSGTKQLTTQAAKTITPSKSSQTAVASGTYTTGAITVAAIPDSYITTTDATASANEIMNGETAYVNGSKVTGTFTIDNELSAQDSLITQIQTALQNKAVGSEPVLQEKTISPSTSVQTVTPDSNYDGLSKVTVNAMPTATQATPSISVNSSGLITASATQSAGYVASGTKSATKQLTTQAAKTITPSTSSQTAVNSGVYTTGTVTVNPIPSNYIVPSGTKTITTNGTHDVKSYASATVNVAGEDVTSETNAYTTKLATLETAITALETELQGKASGGSGGGSVDTCTVTIVANESIWYDIIYVSSMNGYAYPNNDSIMGEANYDILCNSIFAFTSIYNEETGDYIDPSNVQIESDDGTSYADAYQIFIGTSNTTITIG